jgi:hypothetical protein
MGLKEYMIVGEMSVEEKTIVKVTLGQKTIDKLTSQHVIFRST